MGSDTGSAGDLFPTQFFPDSSECLNTPVCTHDNAHDKYPKFKVSELRKPKHRHAGRNAMGRVALYGRCNTSVKFSLTW